MRARHCVALFAGVAGSVASSASASVWTWQYTGSVTNVVNNGYFGFTPSIGTPITATISLNDSLTYVGNPGTQTNAFPAIASGLTLTIGANTWHANNYGVYTQNQNFATNAQIAAQASGSGLYWNAVQQSPVGGPTMTFYTTTAPNVALTPFVFPDLTTPFLLGPGNSGGYVSQFTAQSGEIYFSFDSVTLIAPAPGAGAVLGLAALVAGRRRRG
jgi:hypothetical protein